MTVVRQPPGDFGPFLGGQKVRDAVSGLGRVLPLAYAADRQAGTEREMARVRGATPGARSELARAGGWPQDARWVKLNQLPESSRMIASIP